MRVQYAEGYGKIDILPEWQAEVDLALSNILNGRDIYLQVERDTGLPWAYVAVIHYREANCDFSRQILNGERWDRKTTLHPEGKGPWVDWASAARAALSLKHQQGERFQHLPDMLSQLESWNGWGYLRREVNSPYIWSGSQFGKGVGKYVADGNYNPNATDKQVGCAVLLRALEMEGHWQRHLSFYQLPVRFDLSGASISERARQFQRGLNLALEGTLLKPLEVDGWVGPKTREAMLHLTGFFLGEADG